MDVEELGISVIVAGIVVRDTKASEAGSAHWIEGFKCMKTPGGNEGARIRMYQPRLGLWIDHSTVDVLLCTKFSTISFSVKKRSCSSHMSTKGKMGSGSLGRRALYQTTCPLFSSETLIRRS